MTNPDVLAQVIAASKATAKAEEEARAKAAAEQSAAEARARQMEADRAEAERLQALERAAQTPFTRGAWFCWKCAYQNRARSNFCEAIGCHEYKRNM